MTMISLVVEIIAIETAALKPCTYNMHGNNHVHVPHLSGSLVPLELV